ncbi:MAG: hypothetical protein Q8P92_01970 [Candidatus Daviesbacteria bacterium]|nr:hypothetical protein [Candidatus Daviesbacteria bacterium]
MFLLPFILILLFSLIAFLPSFNLSLFGDDWLAFWRYIEHLGPQSVRGETHLSYFLTPYGAQDILMGFLYNIYGFSSLPYYLTSFALRFIAALSFYPLIIYFTNSKIAAYFAVLFFSITSAGLDTTNWVFNMPTYVTIALFNFFLFFFLKSRETASKKLIFPAAIFYYLAYVVTPIRMHGSIFLIFLLELFWLIKNRNKQIAKAVLFRLLVIVMVFLIIRYGGESQGPKQEPAERFMLGIKTDLAMLSEGKFDFLAYPIATIGSTFIPDNILGGGRLISSGTQLFIFAIIPSYLLFIIILFILQINIKANIKKLFRDGVILSFVWNILVVFIYLGNRQTFSNSALILLVLFGGYILILGLIILLKSFKKSYSDGLFLALCWLLLSFFFAWWWVPNSLYLTTHRYLIVTGMATTIFLSIILSLTKNVTQQRILLALFSLLLIIHLFSTRNYLSELTQIRSSSISDRVWKSIPTIPDVGKDKQPLIFYFEGDGTNGGIIHDVITFGFPPHMALIYNLREGEGLPIPMSDVKEVIAAVQSGESLKAYGLPAKPFPINRIYGFHLEGKDRLINITDALRDKLSTL